MTSKFGCSKKIMVTYSAFHALMANHPDNLYGRSNNGSLRHF